MPEQVNTSMYGTLGQTQPNLLGPLASVVGIQNASNQNALFQQEFGARKAMGEVAQQAVDPETGQVDWNKFATIGSQRPDLAFKMPELLNQVAQRKLMDAQTLKTSLENASAKQQAFGAAALAVSKQHGDNVKVSDLVPAVADLQSQGFVTPQEGISYLSTLGQQKGADLNMHLKALAAQSLRGSELINGVAGSYKDDAFHDENGNPVPGFVSPVMGGASAAPASAAPGSPVQPPAQSAMPGGGAAVAAPPPSPQAAPNEQPARTLTPGPVGAYQQQALKEAADYGKEVNERTGTANQLLLTMQQAQRYLKNFTPGGGTALRSDLAQLADSMGMPKEVLDNISNGSLDDVQAARKTLFGNAMTLAAQLVRQGGGRLNQMLEGKILAEGSPNVDLTEGAISKIMGSMREIAHVQNMESDHFRGRQDQASHGFYNMSNVQNDWAKTFNAYLQARENAK